MNGSEAPANSNSVSFINSAGAALNSGFTAFFCITRHRTDFSGLNASKTATHQQAAACVYSENKNVLFLLIQLIFYVKFYSFECEFD